MIKLATPHPEWSNKTIVFLVQKKQMRSPDGVDNLSYRSELELVPTPRKLLNFRPKLGLWKPNSSQNTVLQQAVGSLLLV